MAATLRDVAAAAGVSVSTSILAADKLHHNVEGATLYACVLYEMANASACLPDLLEP